MSNLAPLLQAFFTERLINQRRVSSHTVASYRDTFRLLLGFAQERTRRTPSQLNLADLDAPLIGVFLDHLERNRHNSIRTRNNRLVAIHSLFRFAALREPAQAELIQRVLAIPLKRFERATVSFLDRDEISAILAAPDTSTWMGRRDHALLALLAQTGLRVSELTNLTCTDVVLTTGAHVACQGKGRKQRCTPLTPQTVSVLRNWLKEYDGRPDSPLFPTRRGNPLSTDAVERLLDKHTRAAQAQCPSLASKRVTPHVLRHSTAMGLLASGVDSAVIALWLGHESLQSTAMYLHADMTIKQRALERTAPLNTPPGRYRPPDALLAFLDTL
jgi:site-specific recombinase XerD